LKITEVETIMLRVPAVEVTYDGCQEDLVVRIHTDEGIVGVGEVDAMPSVIKAIIEAPESFAENQGLKRVLLGENPLDVDRIWDKMYQASFWYGRRGAAIHAISGVDNAIWDIIGKKLSRPVWQLLGGPVTSKIIPYASIYPVPDTAKEIAETAKSYTAQGFKAVKIQMHAKQWASKLGKVIDVIRTTRDEIGSDVELIVDAYQCGWDLSTSIKMARAMESLDVFFLEEPLHPDDMDGFAKLSLATCTRIATGEHLSGFNEYRDLIERCHVSVVQPDLGKAGGITACRKIAELARQHNVLFVPHAWKTDLTIAATIPLLATFSNSRYLEFCTSKSPLRWKLTRESFQPKNGYIELTSNSGLGVELDEQTIERYRVT